MAEDMNPMPTVGRMVHYKEDNRCIAAVVTEVTVNEETNEPTTTVALLCFHPDIASFGISPRRFGVPMGNEEATWHWPERAPVKVQNRSASKFSVPREEYLAATLWVSEPDRNLDRAQVLDTLATIMKRQSVTATELEKAAQILRERK